MDTTIYDHDSDIDVTHKINTIELDNWINHLNYIKKELKNLTKLYAGDLEVKMQDKDIISRFEKKQAENETLLNVLHRYQSSRTDIIECEDMQCDMNYITEHETYRRSYLYHLDKYRRLKDEFFERVQGRINLLRSQL